MTFFFKVAYCIVDHNDDSQCDIASSPLMHLHCLALAKLILSCACDASFISLCHQVVMHHIS